MRRHTYPIGRESGFTKKVMRTNPCRYSLLERVDSALKALRRAIELGYDELDHMMQDPHLENARADRRFRLLLIRMRRLASKRP